jgi:hypothetical protein
MGELDAGGDYYWYNGGLNAKDGEELEMSDNYWSEEERLLGADYGGGGGYGGGGYGGGAFGGDDDGGTSADFHMMLFYPIVVCLVLFLFFLSKLRKMRAQLLTHPARLGGGKAKLCDGACACCYISCGACAVETCCGSMYDCCLNDELKVSSQRAIYPDCLRLLTSILPKIAKVVQHFVPKRLGGDFKTVGMLQHVVGRCVLAGGTAEALYTPSTRQPCVYYSLVVEEEFSQVVTSQDQDGNRSSRTEITYKVNGLKRDAYSNLKIYNLRLPLSALGIQPPGDLQGRARPRFLFAGK